MRNDAEVSSINILALCREKHPRAHTSIYRCARDGLDLQCGGGVELSVPAVNKCIAYVAFTSRENKVLVATDRRPY